MNSGINYNIESAEGVTRSIGEQVKNVGIGLKDEFEALKLAFRNEWVGSDEYACENAFLAQLWGIFNNCKEIGQLTSDFVISAATGFRDMQNKQAQGILEDASSVMSENGFSFTGDVVMNQEITNGYTVTDDGTILEIKNTDAPTFDKTTQLGLQTSGSSDILVGAVDTFAQNVNTKIKSLTENVDVGNAFVAEGQDGKMGIQTLITNVIEGMAKIDQQVANFKQEIIPALVANFVSQSENTSASATASANGSTTTGATN